MRKKITQFSFLALLILMSNFSFAQQFVVDGIKYNVLTGTTNVEVIANSPVYTGSITIPLTVSNASTLYSVKSIGNEAFKWCPGLTSITIPNSVTNIGFLSFYGCYGLKSITIPNSVTNIGSSSFLGCSNLKDINLPNSVTSIGSDAFRACTSLTSISLPNSVTSINSSTFQFCSELTSITIPNSVTAIGNSAFSGCSKLTSITIPKSVTSIGSSAFDACSSLISVNVEWVTPLVITLNTFKGAYAATLNVPYGTKAEYKAAVEWNNFTKVTENTEFISDGIKYYITSPTTVEVIANSPKYSGNIIIPSMVTNTNITYFVKSIGNEAFKWCQGLASITIPNSVTSIDINAFNWCTGLTSITIPNSVTNLGYGAFYNCIGLTNINIPNSITTISDSTFKNCSSLTNITIPNSVTSIEKSAFQSCSSLINITIPNSVTTIGDNAFKECSGLTNITFPNSVTSIGNFSFMYCIGLASITIPKSVTSIGIWAFKGCTALTSITLEANSPITITSSVFERVANANEIFATSIYTTATLYVPAGSKTAYQNDAVWGKFTNIVEYSVTAIDNVNSLNAQLNLFPNPSTDNVTISFTETVSGTVSIIDLQGNVVLTKSLSGNTSNISTANLASGVYVVKITSDKGVAEKQLVVR